MSAPFRRRCLVWLAMVAAGAGACERVEIGSPPPPDGGFLGAGGTAGSPPPAAGGQGGATDASVMAPKADAGDAASASDKNLADGGSTAGDTRDDAAMPGVGDGAVAPDGSGISADGGVAAPRPAGTNLTFHVSPTGNNTFDGLTEERAIATLNQALRWAEPGDTVQLLPGTHIVVSDFGNGGDVVSSRSGRADAPITIKGPPTAIVKARLGSNRDRLFYIVHDHIVFEGFTVDGLRGDDAGNCMAYVDTLIFAHGGMVRDPVTGRSEPKAPRKAITGIKLKNMTLRNSGGECVRFRYFAQKNEVTGSKISRCGAKDFLPGSACKTGVNGEGIYIGTSSNQWADATKNASNEPDQSNENVIRDNEFDTKANECVEVKEGATKNLIEMNRCTGQLDPNSGGFGSRGSGNLFRGNDSSGNKGAGIRLGGHDNYGTANEVSGNTFRNNGEGAFKIMVNGTQGPICGNQITGGVGRVSGGIDPAKPCPK